MSEFDDMMAGALEEAGEVFGQTAFAIDGRLYQGDLGELGENSYSIVVGGTEISVRSALLCGIAQFGGALPKSGTRLKIATRTFVIAGVSHDAVSVTLHLADPDAAG